jgi:spoIIIJ-associated protein
MIQNDRAAEGDERRVLEIRARTVDEAVARGLVRLGGLSRSEVRIDVVQEGKPGLLGFGAEEAAVRLTVLRPGERAEDIEPPAAQPGARGVPAQSEAPVRAREEPPAVEVPPVEEVPRPRERAEAATEPPARKRSDEPAERRPRSPARDEGDGLFPEAEPRAREVTSELLGLLGFAGFEIETVEALLPDELEEEPSLVLSIQGGDVRRLLADDGAPLHALQFLVRLLLSRELDRWVNLLLDVEGDRARRVKELVHLASQSADLVEREGRPVALPPMTAYERRVVHLALQDHPVVATQSIGAGEGRKVTVRRRDQLLPEL